MCEAKKAHTYIYLHIGFLTLTMSELLFTEQCDIQTLKMISMILELKILYQPHISVSFPSIIC